MDMKGYLNCDVRYFTNNGFKTFEQLTDTDKLYYIDENNTLQLLDYYRVASLYSDEFYKHTYTSFSSVYSLDEEDDYITNCLEDCVLYKDEVFKYFTFNIQDRHYRELADFVLVLSFIVSNYFRLLENGNLLQLNKVNASDLYIPLSTIHKLKNIPFSYTKDFKTYSMPKTSLYKDAGNYNEILLNHINYFYSILNNFELLGISKGKYYKNILINNYQTACLIQVLINLLGYKTKLKFDKDTKFFKLTYFKKFINNEKLSKINEICYSKNSLKFNKIISNVDGKLIVSQNINKITTVSFVKIENENFI